MFFGGRKIPRRALDRRQRRAEETSGRRAGTAVLRTREQAEARSQQQNGYAAANSIHRRASYFPKRGSSFDRDDR
jgi:hypothetical protein